MRSLPPIFVLLFMALAGAIAGDGRAAPRDPAARGIDVFVHGALAAPPNGELSLTIHSLGYRDVTTAAPLPGASVEVGWDPATVSAAPPSVKLTTDAAGLGRAAIRMPPGPVAKLDLLVRVSAGDHARVRVVPVERSPSAIVTLHVPDERVVPRSTITSWVRVTDNGRRPIADAEVRVALVEGGVARHRTSVRTDRGGIATIRTSLPPVDQPIWHWDLRAELTELTAEPATVRLTPREETPGKPSVDVRWQPPPGAVKPGNRVPYTVRFRDAVNRPLANQTVRTWVGQGNPPAETDAEGWRTRGVLATTDDLGEVRAFVDVPTLVKAQGTTFTVAAHAEWLGASLDAKDVLVVGRDTASVELIPESGVLVPGVTQRLYLEAKSAEGPAVGKFLVTGDGLSADVTTDAAGRGELVWSAPLGVGGTRRVGPCAGGVAAAVATRPVGIAGLVPITTCVAVDRDAVGIVRVTPDVVVAGQTAKVHLTRLDGGRGAANTFSVLATSGNQRASATAWAVADPGHDASADLVIPKDAAPGAWTVTVAATSGEAEHHLLGTSFLVVPAAIPKLEATAKLASRSAAEVTTRLTDGAGHGLAGSVSAIVVDAFGGSALDVSSLDDRSRLCAEIGESPGVNCDAILGGTAPRPTRMRLSAHKRSLVRPASDPRGRAKKELAAAFAEVLRSLEGAVFEASQDPATLIDVRRREGGRWVLNPELLTLATAALSEAPTTPGGEPIVLSDLTAVDPQVTFDNVARRVTRLKLFRALAAVRDVRRTRELDPNEPTFKDPNALLRRLVRDGTLSPGSLLDPWGGTLQFVRGGKTPGPFLDVVRGFELRAPGPDGVIGTADDVADPFERVLRSGTPYADAVEEDRLVDAKWDMVVSNDTVMNWTKLFERLTGTVLGASGSGEGGGGMGEGIGLGSIGTLGHGMVRTSTGVADGGPGWTAPVRTDADGRVTFMVPLGDSETTWRIAVVGVADGIGGATTVLDVTTLRPLSATVDTGARWVAGDAMTAEVLIRNRTDAVLAANAIAAAEGVATIEGPRSAALDVPAHGSAVLKLAVAAARAGDAKLVVRVSAPSVPGDVVAHTWEVRRAGEDRVLTQAAFVDGARNLALALDHGYTLRGAPRLLLERGYVDAIAAALDSLEPESQTSSGALVDVIDASTRIERWAISEKGARFRALAGIAAGIRERARGRHAFLTAADGAAPRASAFVSTAASARLRKLVPDEAPGAREDFPCPAGPDDFLEAEPPPSSSVDACWGAHVANVTAELGSSRDVARVASAVLALADRPHRAQLAESMTERLRALVQVGSDGELHGRIATDRATRALVYAALLRGARFGTSRVAERTLFARIAEGRDATGGYGSTTATLAVVRALLASQPATTGTTGVRVTARGGFDRTLTLPAGESTSLALPADLTEVRVETSGPGIVARFERPVLRSWQRPPPASSSPVSIDVEWPDAVRAKTTGTLRVKLRRSTAGIVEVDALIPLPPGVTLTTAVHGVWVLQGTLFLRRQVDASGTVVELPLRFGLAGTVTAPEATARITRTDTAVATAPARRLTIR